MIKYISKNKHSQKGFAHILVCILLLMGIGLGIYLIQQKTNLFPQAFHIKSTNNEITRLTSKLVEQKSGKLTASKNASLKKTAAVRKEKLLQLLQTDPGTFLKNATLTNQVKTFPPEVQKDIEEQISVTGKLMVIHQDDFIRKKSVETYYLVPDNVNTGALNSKYKLYLTSNMTNLVAGATLEVKGTALNNQLVVDSKNTQNIKIISLPTTEPSEAQRLITEQKTAVLLVQIGDDVRYTSNSSNERFREQFFGETNSINSYFREVSFGKSYVTGDVFGWFIISEQLCSNGNLDVFANPADAAARAAGVNLEDYFRVVYLFSKDPCNYGAGAQIGFDFYPSRAYIFGTNNQNTRIFIHEFGHNLGVHHSNFLSCPGKVIDDYSKCENREYGDNFDVMGNSEQNHYNAVHKRVLNWIPNSNLQHVTQDGLYKISSQELESSFTQLLKISKPDTKEDYYIEYRQPLGLDALLPVGIVEGASIRIWSKPFFQTKLLDLNPNTLPVNGALYPLKDAALFDGGMFYDSANKILIKQISHDNNSVSLEIKFNISSMPIPSPSSPPASPIPSANITQPGSTTVSPGSVTQPSQTILNNTTSSQGVPSTNQNQTTVTGTTRSN